MATGADAVGRCLNCGGRGGYSRAGIDGDHDVMTCPRCGGTGQDPARDEPWFLALVASLQSAPREAL